MKLIGDDVDALIHRMDLLEAYSRKLCERVDELERVLAQSHVPSGSRKRWWVQFRGHVVNESCIVTAADRDEAVLAGIAILGSDVSYETVDAEPVPRGAVEMVAGRLLDDDEDKRLSGLWLKQHPEPKESRRNG